ncbi:MAG: potassium-transporting ATPase subunit KdpC [Hyphomicrobiaceae bacterium]
MLKQFRPAMTLLVLLTLLTGVAYPLAMTGLAQVVLPGAANGSLVVRDGRVVGSVLIGQTFTADRYFHGRPSAAGSNGYDAAASSGSNLGPLSTKLRDRIAKDIVNLKAGQIAIIPADAVTASASGLDPHISPQYAHLQLPRIARVRGMPEAQVRHILSMHIDAPILGFLGEPQVNVLSLNMALDSAARSAPIDK